MSSVILYDEFENYSSLNNFTFIVDDPLTSVDNYYKTEILNVLKNLLNENSIYNITVDEKKIIEQFQLIILTHDEHLFHKLYYRTFYSYFHENIIYKKEKNNNYAIINKDIQDKALFKETNKGIRGASFQLRNHNNIATVHQYYDFKDTVTQRLVKMHDDAYNNSYEDITTTYNDIRKYFENLMTSIGLSHKINHMSNILPTILKNIDDILLDLANEFSHDELPDYGNEKLQEDLQLLFNSINIDLPEVFKEVEKLSKSQSNKIS